MEEMWEILGYAFIAGFFYSIFYFFLKDASINALLAGIIVTILFCMHGIQKTIIRKKEDSEELESATKEILTQLKEINDYLYSIKNNTDINNPLRDNL